ncbi:MAG: hypothetical protein IPK68_10345 [Bdellovibrionales bacterium]|nr:hypothetical protein [Bdellovibrionales bacterium]
MSSLPDGSLFVQARNCICMIMIFLWTTPSVGQSPAQASLEKMRQDLMKIDKVSLKPSPKLRKSGDARFLPDLYFALGSS